MFILKVYKVLFTTVHFKQIIYLIKKEKCYIITGKEPKRESKLESSNGMKNVNS